MGTHILVSSKTTFLMVLASLLKINVSTIEEILRKESFMELAKNIVHNISLRDSMRMVFVKKVS